MFTHFKTPKRLLFMFAIALAANTSFALQVSEVSDQPARELAVVEDNGTEISSPTEADAVKSIEEKQESVHEIATAIIEEEKKSNESLVEIRAELDKLRAENKKITKLYHQTECRIKEEKTISEELGTSQTDVLAVISHLLQPSTINLLQNLAVAHAFNPPEVRLNYDSIPSSHSNATGDIFGLNNKSFTDYYHIGKSYAAPIEKHNFYYPQNSSVAPQKSELATSINFNARSSINLNATALSNFSFDFNSQSIIDEPRYSTPQRGFSFDQLNSYKAPVYVQQTPAQDQQPNQAQTIQEQPVQIPVNQAPPIAEELYFGPTQHFI